MSLLTRRMQGPEPAHDRPSLSLLQWNVLADGLAHGSFLHASAQELAWETRGERLLSLLRQGLDELPDLLCLQEVDRHEGFFAPRLSELGYEGHFAPKVAGRDGCALFARRDRFELQGVNALHYTDEDSGHRQTQLCLSAGLVPLAGGPTIQVATTHLKAKPGFEELRGRQARQLLDALPEAGPRIVAGDFNDLPDSVAGEVMRARMRSAYASVLGHEAPWTTWKVRASGEVRRTIDYVWYAGAGLRPVSVLAVPDDEEVGPERLPSARYPSDHLSLVVRFELG